MAKRRSPSRYRLPATRRGLTHKFEIAGTEGYISTGEYPDGELGEIFLTVAKEGSTLSGLIDALATVSSIALQYGVPLKTLVSKLSFTRFEPAGITPNPDIHYATSIVDYVYRWIAMQYLTEKELDDLDIRSDPIVELEPHPVSRIESIVDKTRVPIHLQPPGIRERESLGENVESRDSDPNTLTPSRARRRADVQADDKAGQEPTGQDT